MDLHGPVLAVFCLFYCLKQYNKTLCQNAGLTAGPLALYCSVSMPMQLHSNSHLNLAARTPEDKRPCDSSCCTTTIKTSSTHLLQTPNMPCTACAALKPPKSR
jgi:hypothetical protein